MVDDAALKSRRRFTVALLTVGALVGAGVTSAVQAASAPTAKRELLGAYVNPVGANGRTLGLSRVTIPGGVLLPLHYHEGTQIAYVDAGILRYSVKSGHVRVLSGLASGSPKLVRTIGPGQSGNITAGQWLVEQPSTIHTAKGVTRVVVLLANLLRNGAPAATPVK
jgi:hypothetical protein